jgi:hypothetical protein
MLLIRSGQPTRSSTCWQWRACSQLRCSLRRRRMRSRGGSGLTSLLVRPLPACAYTCAHMRNEARMPCRAAADCLASSVYMSLEQSLKVAPRPRNDDEKTKRKIREQACTRSTAAPLSWSARAVCASRTLHESLRFSI